MKSILVVLAAVIAVFVLDVLDPLPDDAVHAAVGALADALLAVSPDAVVHQRLLTSAEARPSWTS